MNFIANRTKQMPDNAKRLGKVKCLANGNYPFHALDFNDFQNSPAPIDDS